MSFATNQVEAVRLLEETAAPSHVAAVLLPVYKAIRSHEEVLVRPFRDKEAALRAYLRYYQWAEIWSSQPTPVAPIAVIRERAHARKDRARAVTRRVSKAARAVHPATGQY